MVWHSFMLNPRCFLEDCLRYNKIGFWKSEFPWTAVNSCIDNLSFEFIGTIQAQHSFSKETGLAWDNLNDPMEIHMACPNCKQPLTALWTTSGACSWSNAGGLRGDGFADKDFNIRCPSCQLMVDHEMLRAGKFRSDVERLLLNDTPMPGTVLKIDGMMASMV